MIYIISGLISLFFAWFSIHSKQYNEWKKWPFVLLSASPLFLVSALRYGIGSDYFEYTYLFRNYSIAEWDRIFTSNIEPLFFAYNKILARLSSDPQVFFVTTAAITVLFVVHVIFRDSTNPVLSIYLYISLTFYLSSFNVARQHIACSILMLSLVYVYKQKPLQFGILIAMATLIHYSAIVFGIVYFLYRINLNPRRVCIASVVLIIMRGAIGQFALRYITTTRYVRYAGETAIGSYASYMGIAVQFVILMFACYYYTRCITPENEREISDDIRNKEKKVLIRDDSDIKFRLLFSCQVMAFWITLFSTIIPRINRIRWIYSYPSIILIPFILSKIPSKNEKTVITFTMIIVLMIYYYVVIYVVGSYGVLPYESILVGW